MLQKNLSYKYCTVLTKIISNTTVSTLLIINLISPASNQHIRMISEGLCDTLKTEVMAAENSVCHNRNKIHFKMY